MFTDLRKISFWLQSRLYLLLVCVGVQNPVKLDAGKTMTNIRSYVKLTTNKASQIISEDNIARYAACCIK